MSARAARLLAGPVGVAAVLAILAGGSAASAASPDLGGSWRSAAELPGIGSLNKGGNAGLTELSCGAPGSCAVGGYYQLSGGQREAFVADERSGKWHAAVKVPGIGALNKGGFAQVLSVSCASAGNCAAGGMYLDGSHHYQAFVATEKDGKWATGIVAPGTKTLNQGGDAAVQSVSCGQAGACAAVGHFRDAAGHSQAFVLTSQNGTWHAARLVPGLAALNLGNAAKLNSVSCVKLSCSAGGSYEDASAGFQGFVVTEKNGTWGTAREVPGDGTINTGGFASVAVVSCGSPGNCAAGGLYHTGPTEVQAFVVNEVNGKWGNAGQVPGTGILNASQDAYITALSCSSAGSCGAAGEYVDGAGHTWPFVVTEKNGTWGKAVAAPGIPELSGIGGFGVINSLSCLSPGNCAGAGQYDDSTSRGQAFLIAENNGRWGGAIKVPGLLALNKDNSADAAVVSCHAPAGCTAGGLYHDASGRQELFVIARH